jgi:peptide subunit release factor 1 (eRF1)
VNSVNYTTKHGIVLQISRAQKMLGDEFGTASNIKNRVNRQSVLGAITSAQQRLKLYNKVNKFHLK